MLKRKFRALPTRIDHAMEELKISAEAIGRAAGHSDGSYIRRMRRGEKKALSATLATAEAVSRMLGLPLEWFFVEVDPRTGRDLVRAEDSETPGLERAS